MNIKNFGRPFTSTRHGIVENSSLPTMDEFGPIDVPGPPTLMFETHASNSAVIIWNAPLHDSGLAVDTYKVEYSTGGSDWITATYAATSPYVLNGLFSGLAYRVRVKAHNDAGYGLPALLSFATWAKPGMPTGLSAKYDSASATINWEPPATDGGVAIDGYMVEYSLDEFNWKVVTTDHMAPLFFAGLEAATKYFVRVSARNAVGYGPVSKTLVIATDSGQAVATKTSPVTAADHSGTPVLPDAPTAVSQTHSGTVAHISWDQPSSIGAGIDGYKIEYSTDDEIWMTATVFGASPYVFAGLTPQTNYRVRVSAHSVWGFGPTSTPISFVTLAVPDAPSSVTARTNDDGATVVTWIEPASRYGTDIDGYKVETSTDGLTWIVVSAPNEARCELLGLSKGVKYQIRVSAHDVVGFSAPSTPIVVGVGGPRSRRFRFQ